MLISYIVLVYQTMRRSFSRESYEVKRRYSIHTPRANYEALPHAWRLHTRSSQRFKCCFFYTFMLHQTSSYAPSPNRSTRRERGIITNNHSNEHTCILIEVCVSMCVCGEGSNRTHLCLQECVWALKRGSERTTLVTGWWVCSGIKDATVQPRLVSVWLASPLTRLIWKRLP